MKLNLVGERFDAGALPAQPWSDGPFDPYNERLGAGRVKQCDLDGVGARFVHDREPSTPSSSHTHSCHLGEPLDARPRAAAGPHLTARGRRRESEHSALAGSSQVDVTRDELLSDGIASRSSEPEPQSSRKSASARRTKDGRVLTAAEEAKRLRRVLSNRESARRSRQRKQTQLQQLEQTRQALGAKTQELERQLENEHTQQRRLVCAVRALHDDNKSLRKQVETWASMANVSICLADPAAIDGLSALQDVPPELA